MKTKRSEIDASRIKIEIIANMIYVIRGQKVMLDSDLAVLYGVETKQLKRAVKRNINRFPMDFLFELTKQEYNSLRCQFGTLKRGQHTKYFPYAFTEQGVAMLSSVLKSERAVQVNIVIMRTFIKLREMMATHKELKEKIEEMEKKYDKQFQVVFAAIKDLFDKFHQPDTPKKGIGFHVKYD